MISCTQPGCREPGRVGLVWTEMPLSGWTVKNDRIFCSSHADEAIAQLQQRGISVNYSSYGVPQI